MRQSILAADAACTVPRCPGQISHSEKPRLPPIEMSHSFPGHPNHLNFSLRPVEMGSTLYEAGGLSRQKLCETISEDNTQHLVIGHDGLMDCMHHANNIR